MPKRAPSTAGLAELDKRLLAISETRGLLSIAMAKGQMTPDDYRAAIAVREKEQQVLRQERALLASE